MPPQLFHGYPDLFFSVSVANSDCIIIQGLVIVFIAAPAIIRWFYRIRSLKTEETVLTRGWGK